MFDLPMLPARPRNGYSLLILTSCDHEGCERVFWKRVSEYVRRPGSYCSSLHSIMSIQHLSDRSAPGRGELISKGQLKVPKEVRIARARKAGLSRARNLSKERLREIALIGNEALKKRFPPETRGKRLKLNWERGNFRRYGKLKRSCWAYIVSPGIKMRSVDDANHR